MNRKLRLPLALALALGSGSAFALGLGQVQVKSSLYEPLEAEIPVLSGTPGEADALVVRLASPEAFARVGLERPQLLAANLEFAVVENARGQKVIRITTANKVNDPFLSFLVEADWGKGKLLREFTVLLDPPGTAPVARAAATAPVRETAAAPQPASPQPASPQPAADPAPAAQPAATAPAAAEPEAPVAPPAQPAASPAAPSGGDYPVAAGDTLWSIAQRTRPDASVSVNQMMVALLQANPDAFIDENINRIKSGAILRIPDRAALAQLDAAQANTTVREQMDAWRGARAPQLQPAEPDAAAVATAPARAPAPQSRLELVPPRGDQPAEGARSGVDAQSGAGTELRADLARAREEIGARDQQIAELRSQVEDLEGIRADSERLIALKNSELETLQRRLAELEAERQADADAAAATPATADASVAPAGADAATPPADAAAPATVVDADGDGIADAPAGDTATAADADGDAADDAGTDAAAPATAADAAGAQVGEGTTAADAAAARAAQQAEAAPAPAAAQPAPAREIPWYRNPNLWVIGGIVLVVGGLLAFLLGRRKPRAETSGTGTRGYDSGALAAAVPGAVGVAHGADEIDEHESEHEAALLDALAERPEDLGRHLDLARYYYEQGDADAFEGAAEAMYAQIYDPDNLMWMQVVAMGRELLPDHPLFAAPADELAPADGDLAPAAPRQDWDATTDPADVTAATPAAVDEWSDATADSDDRDFEYGDRGASGELAFDGEQDAGAPAPQVPPAAATPEYDTPTFQTPVFEPPADEADDADAGDAVPPYRAPETEAEAPYEYGGDDASSTKLELARAYLDMGDVEGARGMLEEVMGEGNAGQRAEARRLLDEIR